MGSTDAAALSETFSATDLAALLDKGEAVSSVELAHGDKNSIKLDLGLLPAEEAQEVDSAEATEAEGQATKELPLQQALQAVREDVSERSAEELAQDVREKVAKDFQTRGLTPQQAQDAAAYITADNYHGLLQGNLFTLLQVIGPWMSNHPDSASVLAESLLRDCLMTRGVPKQVAGEVAKVLGKSVKDWHSKGFQGALQGLRRWAKDNVDDAVCVAHSLVEERLTMAGVPSFAATCFVKAINRENLKDVLTGDLKKFRPILQKWMRSQKDVVKALTQEYLREKFPGEGGERLVRMLDTLERAGKVAKYLEPLESIAFPLLAGVSW